MPSSGRRGSRSGSCNANQDALLLALEIVVEALADVRGKLRPAALTDVLDGPAGNRLQLLRNRLNDARQ